MNLRTPLLGLTGALVATSLIGCGDPAEDTDQELIEGTVALASTVSADDTNTTYITGLESLDVSEVSLDDALEYPGYATIGAVDGMFFVAEGEAPLITRYRAEGDGPLEKDGELNLSEHLSEAPFYSTTMANATTAYVDYEDRGHVVWNPSTMEYVETHTTEEIEAEKEGYSPFRSFKRGTVVRDNLVFQPFHWRDADHYHFAQDSEIVVYDATDNSVVNVIEAPCPGLDVASMDEEGNIYFTTWVNAPSAPFLEDEDETHSLCAVRIEAGETTLDESWTQDLSEMTGGRIVAAMRIIEGDTAVAAVLDHDKIEVGPETDDTVVTYASNWELWRLDLSEGTGEKVPDTDHIAGGYYAFNIDGRIIVTLPNADYSSTGIYEITADGPAEKLFEVEGWVYQMVELD